MDSRPLFSSNGSGESIWTFSVPGLVDNSAATTHILCCMACCKYCFTGCLPTEWSCSPVFERQPKCCQSIIAARDSLCCTIVQGRQCCAKYRTDVSCCENYRDGVCCKAVEKGISCVETVDEGAFCARMEDGRCCTNAQGVCQRSGWQQKLDGESYTPLNLVMPPQNW